MLNDKQLLTIAEIARRLDLPESTCRYYRDRFEEFIPSIGEGRKRRYRPETADVLRTIAEGMNRNLTATEIEDRLSREFPRNIEPVDQSQPTTAATQQQQLPSVALFIALLAQQQQALEQVAAALERLSDQQEQTEALRRDLDKLRQELEVRDKRIITQMREAMQERQNSEPPPKRWWWPFGR